MFFGVEVEIEAATAVVIGIFATSEGEVGVVESCEEGHWSHP